MNRQVRFEGQTTMRSDPSRVRAPWASRWLVIAFAGLGLAGCAPTGEETAESLSPIPDRGITPEEFAQGASDPGHDRVEPWEGIDGDVRALAPPATAGSDDVAGEASTRVDGIDACRPATGYSRGRPVSICVTTVDGKLVEYRTAEAYLRMKAAALRAGVRLQIVSGWRTMERQRELYAAYRAGRGNLAAAPGYSNHQNGLALDLNTSAAGVASWLTAHASEYGFRRTVPGEPWHYERTGAPGPATGTADGSCLSQTLERRVPRGTCVESRFDRAWYQCIDGGWRVGRGSNGPCTASFPLSEPRPAPANTTCQSATLGREVRVGVCLQSRLDEQWYQCTAVGWSLERSLPGSRRGSAGACSELHPLR